MWGYILGIILGSIVLVGLISMLVFYLARSWVHQRNIKMIGLKSEVKINNDIKTWARQTNNLFLPSTLFKYKLNQIFEVDSILITPQALFIIEIKSIRGIIEGDAEMSYWNKRVGDKSFKIANPIIQNEKHIDHITKMINAQVPTVSLVIFSNRADYIKVENAPSHVLVFKHNQLFEKLDSIESSLSVSLTKYEMRMLYGKLRSFKTRKFSDIKFHKKITKVWR